MKFKFHWGHGIVLVIILFFGTIALRVYISYQHDIQLEDNNYYEKELTYQDQIDKERNTQNLVEKVVAMYNEPFLKISFPETFKGNNIEGTILLYRPSDAILDKDFILELDSNLNQTIEEKLAYGRYIIKLEWKADGNEYYQEIKLDVD